MLCDVEGVGDVAVQHVPVDGETCGLAVSRCGSREGFCSVSVRPRTEARTWPHSTLRDEANNRVDVDERHGVDAVQRPLVPLTHLLYDRIGDQAAVAAPSGYAVL